MDVKRYRVTAAGGLNIRSGPGTDFADWGDLAPGQVVKSPATSEWVPILLQDGTVGWAALEYLEEVSGREAPLAEPEAGEKEAGPGYDFSTKEGTIEAIKAECRKQGLGLPAQIAYVLATVEWETGRTFKPVREAYWKSEDWRRQHLARYYPYYGRGYVQLTWSGNYRKYAQITGQDLVGQPNLAMEPQTALFILVHGMRTGAFTGKSLGDYVDEEGYDFYNARRVVNGVDKAAEIEELAEKYLEELEG